MFLLFLVACGADVTIDYQAEGCQNWDLDSETSEVAVVRSPDGIEIVRSGVMRGCDSVFTPTIDAEGFRVLVFEAWTDVDGDDCETCWAPSVSIHNPLSGDYELFWFDESSSVTPIWSDVVSL